MSEAPVVDPAQADATDTPPETDWKAEARKWEARAKANAEAVKKVEQFEEAQKTAEQKAADREAAAESRVIAAEARATRREVALEHKLTPEDAALLDAITEEDAMRALAARLEKQSDTKKSNHVPREGMNQTSTADERRAFVRRLTGRDD